MNRRHFLKTMQMTAMASPLIISACKPSSPDNSNPDTVNREPVTLPPRGSSDTDLTFPSSVASGDPTPSGAIIWTRIASDRVVADEPLLWEVALDSEFTQQLASGSIGAEHILETRDYTIKLDLNGLLPSNQFLYYRFAYNGVSSRTGRLRTLPEANEEVAKLKLLLATCQDFTLGRFHAYAEISQIDDADYLVHLGDFIYESAIIAVGPDRVINLPSGAQYAEDLADFRHIYRTHRSETDLQAALEKHTLLHTWDDHEIANDRYWDGERPRGPDHPLDSDPEAFTQCTRDGIQAWFEYLPVRVPYDPDGDFPDLIEVERSFRFGNLADIVLTELRMHRDEHPCGTGNYGERQLVLESSCPQRHLPDRTMMGTEQRDWMLDSLQNSTALWKVLGQPIPFSPIKISQQPPAVYETDHWDDYTDERSLILNEIRNRAINNLILLSGDLHAFLAADLYEDYDQASQAQGNIVGAEFATSAVAATPIASFNPPANVFLQQANIQSNNPHINFWDGTVNGWCEVTFTPESCRVVMRSMLAQAPAANPSLPLAEFEVKAGQPGLTRLS